MYNRNQSYAKHKLQMLEKYLIDCGIEGNLVRVMTRHIVANDDTGYTHLGIGVYSHKVAWSIIKAGFFYDNKRWRGWLGEPNKWYTTQEIICQIFRPLSQGK